MAQVRSKPQKNKTLLILIVVAVVGAISLVLLLALKHTTEPARGNTHINEYMQANWNAELARDIPYPARTQFAVLRGSWSEMGQQYGESFGKYIRIMYDANYGMFLNSKLDPNKLGPVLDKYLNETEKFSPEMVKFMQGMAKGAEAELNGADNAAALNNTQKIILINTLFEVVIPPAWPHVAEMMGVQLPQPTAKTGYEPFASHAWAAWGNMTTDGRGIMGGTRDQPWMPTLYNVSYVAIPSDPDAAVTWGNAIAGHVASSAQVNANGVGLGNTVISHAKQEFGVPALLSTAHISFFAKTAKEAADMLTLGTPEYRERTGRATLFSTVGFFHTFADASKGYTVERTGRHYAVREAGTQNEKGDYTVLANHAVAGFSNNELGQPTNQPMQDWTLPGKDNTPSIYRYWTLFYELGNNVGKVTPEVGRQTIAKLKYAYTEDGQKVTEKDGIPIWRFGLTPERWLVPDPKDPNSLATGGNNMYFVADLKNLDIYWVQGLPSHWQGDWDHVSLRNPNWR